MKIKTKADRRERIHLRQRKRIMGTTERPRLSVFRSVTHIYAQVIDDLSGKTIVSAASTDPKLKGEFAKDARGGNLKGAVNASRGTLEFRADPESPSHDPAFQKDKKVLVYCASAAGRR